MVLEINKDPNWIKKFKSEKLSLICKIGKLKRESVKIFWFYFIIVAMEDCSIIDKYKFNLLVV